MVPVKPTNMALGERTGSLGKAVTQCSVNYTRCCDLQILEELQKLVSISSHVSTCPGDALSFASMVV